MKPGLKIDLREYRDIFVKKNKKNVATYTVLMQNLIEDILIVQTMIIIYFYNDN